MNAAALLRYYAHRLHDPAVRTWRRLVWLTTPGMVPASPPALVARWDLANYWWTTPDRCREMRLTLEHVLAEWETRAR